MANIYDRIFKENIDELLPHLLREILGWEVPKLEDLKDKLQVTLEREVDIFKKVIHDDHPEKDHGLHCEIQGQDMDMRARELLYYGMFHHRYKLPLRQIVIYIGEEPAHHIMNNILELEGIRLEFTVIDLHSIPKDVFLQSNKPECVLLALLADYGQDKPEKVVRQILHNLTNLVGNKTTLRKYQKQLLVLSRLRNLTAITTNIINTMPIHFDIETDVLYREGTEKGVEKGTEKAISVANMLLKGHSISEIVAKLNVTIAYVQNIALKMELPI